MLVQYLIVIFPHIFFLCQKWCWLGGACVRRQTPTWQLWPSPISSICCASFGFRCATIRKSGRTFLWAISTPTPGPTVSGSPTLPVSLRYYAILQRPLNTLIMGSQLPFHPVYSVLGWFDWRFLFLLHCSFVLDVNHNVYSLLRRRTKATALLCPMEKGKAKQLLDEHVGGFDPRDWFDSRRSSYTKT